MSTMRNVAWGIAAGAAGTTALNATTYLDMLVRGRPASTVPSQTAEEMAKMAHVDLGDDEAASGRKTALGALMGIATGVGVGAAYGLAASAVEDLPVSKGALIAGGAALVAGEGAPVAMGKADPREWGVNGWLSGVIPHLVYGIAVAGVFRAATQESLVRRLLSR